MTHYPPIPRRIRRGVLAAVTAFLALAAVILTAPEARAATPVYAGTGWKILTSQGIYSLNPDPYTIVFADVASRDMLTPYLTKPAAQATAASGVQITVSSDIDTTPYTVCPARHRIVVHLEYRPMGGTPGYSQTLPCHDPIDGSATGGHVRMDSEYWTTTSALSSDPTTNSAMIANAVTHELGHALGLDHPNSDLDKDGTVEAYECPVNDANRRPVMCAPSGGNFGATTGGNFLTFADQPGLAQLAANWYARQGLTATTKPLAPRTADRPVMGRAVH